VIIDQLRADYLVRFRPHFVPRGFNLLLQEGANFVSCRFDYASTFTGPGHATLLTGTYPSVHGIVGNEWYDRARRRTVHCVRDAETVALGARGGPGYSPRHLIGTTLGDELRMATDFQSKVISVSLKDYSATLAGGHTANAAYSYDSASGHFVTSTYYLTSLPQWVQEFNFQQPSRQYCEKAWVPLPETPGGKGKLLSEFRPTGGGTCPSPHFLTWLANTPFISEIEFSFAERVIRAENLGQDAATDLLIVSVSANDWVGHAHGPYSLEVADATLRTDRYLADFFTDIDKAVGLENVWIVLAADHGVAPTPDYIVRHRIGIGLPRVGAVEAAVQKALAAAYGAGQWVEHSDGTSIYLNSQTIRRHGVEKAKAEIVAAEAALGVPGVLAAIGASQIASGSTDGSPLARKVANSFNRQRSGDVIIVVEPYAVPSDRTTSTTHGSPWNYDTHIPLILWGSVFRAGIYMNPCEPIDLVPTLAVLLGVTPPPGCEGRPLNEAFEPVIGYPLETPGP